MIDSRGQEIPKNYVIIKLFTDIQYRLVKVENSMTAPMGCIDASKIIFLAKSNFLCSAFTIT